MQEKHKSKSGIILGLLLTLSIILNFVQWYHYDVTLQVATEEHEHTVADLENQLVAKRLELVESNAQVAKLNLDVEAAEKKYEKDVAELEKIINKSGIGSTISYSSYAYIGNVQTKKFHRKTCSYLPGASNQIKFKTRKYAIESGYSRCSHCKP